MSQSRRPYFWLPPLLLMGVIFVVSPQPRLNPGLGVIDLIRRKILHFADYALPCLLLWRAFATVTDPRRAALELHAPPRIRTAA